MSQIQPANESVRRSMQIITNPDTPKHLYAHHTLLLANLLKEQIAENDAILLTMATSIAKGVTADEGMDTLDYLVNIMARGLYNRQCRGIAA